MLFEVATQIKPSNNIQNIPILARFLRFSKI